MITAELKNKVRKAIENKISFKFTGTTDELKGLNNFLSNEINDSLVIDNGDTTMFVRYHSGGKHWYLSRSNYDKEYNDIILPIINEMFSEDSDEFTLKDLKTGMKLIFENGDEIMVLKDSVLGDIFIGCTYGQLDYLGERFDHKFMDFGQVVEIVEPENNMACSKKYKDIPSRNYKTVWSRKPQETVMTIRQLEEKYNIKNLKIVK